jgi:restriction system protein
MPVPDYETLMLPVLRCLADGARSVRECLPALQHRFAISDAEAAEMLPSGRTTILSSRAHWARTYLSKAGLLASPRRGVHEVTDRGRVLLLQAPERIDNAMLRGIAPGFSEWLDRSRATGSAEGEPGSGENSLIPNGSASLPETSPEETIERAHELIESALADELLAQLVAMDAVRFERVVLDLLTAMGYGAGSFGSRSLTPASGDGGIDGIIHEDALGLDAVYVQAKRYAPELKVGRPAIQQFVGTLTGEGASKGVFVTTSGFSAEARDFLRRVQQRIVLIDGRELARRMIRHGVGVRVRQRLEIKMIDSDYFDEVI